MVDSSNIALSKNWAAAYNSDMPSASPIFLPTPAFGDSFTVIDINGIHDVGLNFCGCGRHGTMAQQLLCFRRHPATVQNPNTAATFRTLHHFQLLSFESKCSVYEFHQTLVRESDNTSLLRFINMLTNFLLTNFFS